MKITRKQAKELGIPIPKKPTATQQQGNGRSGRRKKMTAVGDSVFDALCKSYGLPEPVHEYAFHPTRGWKFDYLFSAYLAVEREGGAFAEGRHTRGAGFRNDIEKYNEAARLGYVVLRFLPEQFDSGFAFEYIRRVLLEEEELP